MVSKVDLDTTGATWVGDSLKLKVTVSSGMDAVHDLMVPVSDRGEPDYSNVATLAQTIAQAWVRQYKCPNQDRIKTKVKESLDGQVDEYVRFIIASERCAIQAGWDLINRELDSSLEKADSLLKEAKDFRADLDKHFRSLAEIKADQAARGMGDFSYNVVTSYEKITGGLSESLVKIERELAKLPGQVAEGVSAHADDIMKGLEFGFRAAGVVVEDAVFTVLDDVFTAVMPTVVQKSASFLSAAKYGAKSGSRILKFIAHPPAVVDFAAGRYLAAEVIIDNLISSKSKAENINRKILEIKNNIYGNQDK